MNHNGTDGRIPAAAAVRVDAAQTMAKIRARTVESVRHTYTSGSRSPGGRQKRTGVPLRVKDGRTDCWELRPKTTQEQRVLKSTNPPPPPLPPPLPPPALSCSASARPDRSAGSARFRHRRAPPATVGF